MLLVIKAINALLALIAGLCGIATPPTLVEPPDTAKPVVSSLTATVTNSTSHCGTAEGSFTDNAALKSATVNVYNESNTGSVIRALGSQTLSGTSDSASWAIPCDLPDGVYTARTGVSDVAGTGVATKTVQFRVDNTAPSDFAVISPANGVAVRGVITVQARVTDPSDITKLLVNVGGKSLSWNNGSSATITRNGDVFSFTVDTATLADGPVYVVLRATDGVGNTRYWNNNAAIRQHSFVVDNTGPVGDLRVEGLNGNTVVGGEFTVAGHLTDPSGLNRAYVQLVHRGTSARYGGTTINLLGQGNEADWARVYNAAELGLPEGLYAAHVALVDKLGNVTNIGWTENFVLDLTAPNISWQLQPNATYAAGQGFHVRPITSEVGTTKSVYIDSVAPENLVWTLTSDHKNFDTKNTHNQALWDGLADGTHAFIAVFTDTAGNTSTSTSNAFITDRTGPTITVKPESLGTNGVYRNVSFKLHDPLCKVDKLTLNGVAKDLTDNAWSDLNGVKPGVFGAVEGNNTLVVFDVCGNSSTLTFMLDTVAPTITVKPGAVVGPNGAYTTVPSFALADAGNGQIDYVVINGVVKQLTNNKWSDLNKGGYSPVQGTNTIEVFDTAGNSTTFTFVLDTVAPVVVDEAQEWQTKDGGRTSVTLTFSEPVSGLGQGWYGSGTTWNKVYYNTKPTTVNFTDVAGNAGSYSFTPVGAPPAAAAIVEPEVTETAPVVDTTAPAPAEEEVVADETAVEEGPEVVSDTEVPAPAETEVIEADGSTEDSVVEPAADTTAPAPAEEEVVIDEPATEEVDAV